MCSQTGFSAITAGSSIGVVGNAAPAVAAVTATAMVCATTVIARRTIHIDNSVAKELSEGGYPKRFRQQPDAI